MRRQAYVRSAMNTASGSRQRLRWYRVISSAAVRERHRLDACPVKTWTFTTYTIAAFCCSGLAVLLLIVNAVTANAYLTVLLPVAVVILVIGGILSVRARLLRYRARDTSKR